MDSFLSKLNRIYDEAIETDVSLSTYTKVGIGDQAKFFLPCNNLESFNKAIAQADENKIPYLTIKFDEDVLVGAKVIDQLVIFLVSPENNLQKTIELFQPVIINNEIKKILIDKKFENSIINNKFISPDNIFLKMGLIDKVFGGLKQIPDNPNTCLNFKQATVDDVVIMSSYLKQQVRDKLGIQLRDNYKFITDNN